MCRSRQNGVAILEFALILPLLLVLIFGAIELSWIIYVRTQLQHIVQHSARVAVTDTQASNNSLTDDIQTALQSLHINPAAVTITITPTEPSTANRGDPITVAISVPANSVAAILVPVDISTLTLKVDSTMAKEY